jgi:hypothetical protein
MKSISFKRALADLAERTTRAEAEASRARETAARSERRAALAQEQVARLENREQTRLSRAAFLARAGGAAAGAAGILLANSRPAAAADGGNVVLGASGDTLNPNLAEHPTEVQLDGSVTPTPRIILLGNDSGYSPSGAGWSAAVGGWGNTRAGVYGYSKSGDGVIGWTVGGGAVAGVRGLGGDSPGATPPAKTGIVGTGGSPGGAGVIGAGAGAGAIQSSTGWPFAGVGVYGVGGSANGQGLIGLGGGTSGEGVVAFGAGWPNIAASASGLAAYGGSQAYGVYATGGIAVYGSGTPSGTGVRGAGATGVVGEGGATGLGGYFTGGEAPVSLAPAATPGPPTSGSHRQGDIMVDSRGAVWVCTVAGIPGTFVPLQQGGTGNAIFTAASTKQYTLVNSDGVTWVDMDGTMLTLTITPAFNCQGIFSINADLWTSTAGFNQDVAIFISGGAYGSGQLVAWKESGGFAGTFSPNAAYVETVQPLVAGTAYTIKVQWKANKAGASTIWAAAGPIPAGSGTFSPTRLTGLLVATA